MCALDSSLMIGRKIEDKWESLQSAADAQEEDEEQFTMEKTLPS